MYNVADVVNKNMFINVELIFSFAFIRLVIKKKYFVMKQLGYVFKKLYIY